MTVPTEHLGTPVRDGQFDPPPVCSVCGRADQIPAHRPGLPGRSRLIEVPAWPGGNRFRLVCENDLRTAMQSLGPGGGSEVMHVRSCSAPHPADDDTRYAVVAVWPRTSFAPPPYWLACAPHLNEALDRLAAERTPA